jgi:hypothetical protein
MSFAMVSSLGFFEHAIANPSNAVKRAIEIVSLCVRIVPPP